MRAGDVVRLDFGLPVGSEPGFVRPAVVVSADHFLAGRTRTINVVPLTSNVRRDFPSDVLIQGNGARQPSVAQCHLCTAVSVERLLEDQLGVNVGAVSLAQIRSIIADLLDIP